jgi:hypothetical protein
LTTTERLSSNTIPLTKASNVARYLPLFFGVAMIVAAGVATSATGGSNNGLGQQIPPKTDPSKQIPTQKAEPPKPVLTRAEDVPGITFADKSSLAYMPIRVLAQRLGVEVELAADEKTVTIGDKSFKTFRRLYGGDVLIRVEDISKFGGVYETTHEPDKLLVRTNLLEFNVLIGKKHIEVDKAAQELTAYQGDVVVIKTNVSTGRPGHNTPNGEFTTGPKERMHYSHKYNDAEMPFAVQVNGDVFFHGFGSVPSYPASHGCIRVPLGRKNPAKYLYSWVTRGIPVKISGTYEWKSHRTKHKRRKKH